MRLIFLSLVAVNVLLALWGFFLRDTSEPVSSQAAPAKSLVAPVAPVPVAEVEEKDALCELVGPFPDEEQAAIFVERLRSIDVLSSVEHIELPAGASYWVHLPPEDSARAAIERLNTLQAQGIESYVIARGELKNAVSLGVFTVERLAQARLAEMKAKGLEAEIRTVQRTQIEVWVEVAPESAENMSDLTWARMLEGLDQQERRQNFCLPVAS